MGPAGRQLDPKALFMLGLFHRHRQGHRGLDRVADNYLLLIH